MARKPRTKKPAEPESQDERQAIPASPAKEQEGDLVTARHKDESQPAAVEHPYPTEPSQGEQPEKLEPVAAKEAADTDAAHDTASAGKIAANAVLERGEVENAPEKPSRPIPPRKQRRINTLVHRSRAY